MKLQDLNKPFIKFVALSALSLVAWFSFYYLYLEPNETFDRIVTTNLADTVIRVLGWIGIEASHTIGDETFYGFVGLEHGSGVSIGSPCNGISLMAVFFFIVVNFPTTIKRKVTYSIIGLLAIHVLNILRITIAAWLNLRHHEYLDFNHTYTFNFVIYTLIFLVWYKLMNLEEPAQTPASNNG